MVVRDFVVYCLAAYGLLLVFAMLLEAARFVRRQPGAAGKSRVLVVLCLRNASTWIEDVIRSLLWCGSNWGVPLEITVVDLGSSDETVQILRRLAKMNQPVTVARCISPEQLKRDGNCAVIVCDLSGCAETGFGIQGCVGELLSRLCVIGCIGGQT